MRFLGVAYIFLFLTNLPLNGQEVQLNDNCKEAYQQILSLQFNEAEQKLENEKEINPDNLYVPYLNNYIDFLTVFISEDKEQFELLEENKSDRINSIKKLSDTSRFKKYMLGNIHLQWAVSRLKFNEYFTAAIEINKAYRYLDRNTLEFPEFVPNKISLGVLHVMIGMVPKKYQWLLNLISMKGSVEQGREELEFVLEQSEQNSTYKYLKTETLFYLGFIDLNIKPDPNQLAFLLSELELNRNDNLLLSYLSISILMRTGKNDRAIFVLEENMNLNDFYPFYYLEYLYGECRLRSIETKNASKSYHIFLSNFNGKNYIGDAWRKLGWAALIDGKTSTYQVYMKNVLQFGNTEVGIDKEAKKEAESGVIPNVDLIKARLYFDGGYYQMADSTLGVINKHQLSSDEKIECEYRHARIAHKEGNIELAKVYYLETIESGRESKRYYAGNAALKTAEIFESEGGSTEALVYYNLCLDLDFDEYENSIHAKAKAGIERLESKD